MIEIQGSYKNLVFLLIIAVLAFSSLSVNAQNTKPNTMPAIVPTVPVVVPDKFVVPLNSIQDQIAQSLLDGNYIKDKKIFISIFSKTKGDIMPGAYKINVGQTVENISKILHGKPYMKWVVIPPGLRKEEIAEILATNLNWTTETQLQVANRLVDKFNEKFAPYLLSFNKQNTQWTKGLTLASIVQREAANDADMPLIAGILLNRLNQKIPLSVDATLQYIRGDKGKGWWAPISVADKKTISPYNTYKNVGLPPHPISNPGLPAILAVLNPTKTDCLYYLHDKDHIIHCAVTYTEHQANILKYLK